MASRINNYRLKIKKVTASALVAVMFLSGAVSISAKQLENNSASETENTISSSDKVSPDVREHLRQTQSQTASVILQFTAQPSGRLNALLQRNGVRVKGRFASLDAITVELPVSVLNELSAFPEVESVTRYRDVISTGYLTTTTGTDAIRSLPSVSGGDSMSVDGTGVGIAVLDSGIYSNHLSLKDIGGGSRTVFVKDSTGEETTEDPYGHGSHVASTAAGNGKLSGPSGTFAGVAPNSKLINLRVLNSRGICSATQLRKVSTLNQSTHRL